MSKTGDVYHKDHEYHKCTFKYSETPPYGRISLLRPLLLAAWQNGHAFSCKKSSLMRSPLNTAKLFCPIGDRINGVPL